MNLVDLLLLGRLVAICTSRFLLNIRASYSAGQPDSTSRSQALELPHISDIKFAPQPHALAAEELGVFLDVDAGVREDEEEDGGGGGEAIVQRDRRSWMDLDEPASSSV